VVKTASTLFNWLAYGDVIIELPRSMDSGVVTGVKGCL